MNSAQLKITINYIDYISSCSPSTDILKRHQIFHLFTTSLLSPLIKDSTINIPSLAIDQSGTQTLKNKVTYNFTYDALTIEELISHLSKCINLGIKFPKLIETATLLVDGKAVSIKISEENQN